jgi:hypothetical protein
MSSSRVMRAAALVCMLAAAPGWAAEPAEGRLSLDQPELVFTSGPALISDPATGGCPDSPACDRFDLSIDLPENFATTNPSAQIRIVLTADIPSDYDLFLLDENGEEIASSGNPPPSAETIITAAGQGQRLNRVEVLSFAASGATATVTINLLVPEELPPEEVPVASGLPPRFHYNQSPNGVANGAGEPTVGFNPATGRLMFIAGLEPVRITPVERTSAVDAAGAPLPASCEPVWESKPYAGNVNTLDPILHTEQSTGRTLQSQLSGANSIFSISDDDGDTWTPGQVAPPNGGVDHQSVGSGPYSPNFTGVANPDGYAVYYCSQSVAAAFCARSDDGGQTFGPGVPMFSPLTDCNGSIGALHGHVQVAPDDGTVYVPFGNCGGEQAVAVSEDSGLTWNVKTVPQTTSGDDPGVGVGAEGSVYFCYVNDADGQPRMAVSRDKGETWINHRNLAAGLGIATAVFPTAVAGDDDRAACAWLGTDDPSPGATASNSSFPGFWYPYVSITYDGGESYHTVNVSPTDPVQGAGGICLAGTTCGSNRNLLDFNDVIIDDIGRVVFAHADGCIGTCVADPSRNTFSDNGVIARQSGGRTLFAAFDNRAGTRFNAAAPIAPEPACLDEQISVRDTVSARLSWKAPDSGGAPVTRYEILRATAASGPYVAVGTSDRTNFTDTSADPQVAEYFYAVVAQNASGAGARSNVIALPVSEIVEVDTCSLPGDRFILDALGDGGAEDTDIEFIAAAELPSLPDHIAVTYKVANFTTGMPPASAFYPVLFQNLLGDGVNRYFGVDASQALPRHVFGSYTDVSAGVLAFEEEGELEGDIGADGTMVTLVPRSFFGDVAVGEPITGFDARARVGAQSATSRDTAGPGGYVVRGTAACAVVDGLLASLDADRVAGDAPLTVQFTVSGTAPEGRSLQGYELEFGDGETASGSFNGADSVNVPHTYAEAGNYRAALTVIDSEGGRSGNAAAKLIEVLPAGSGGDSDAGERDRGRFGGALGALLLAPLLLSALLRRRRD